MTVEESDGKRKGTREKGESFRLVYLMNVKGVYQFTIY